MKTLINLVLCILIVSCNAPSVKVPNNRQQVRNEMQQRPGDLWPRGEGHAVLAIPGSLEQEKAYLEPGGGFSPAFGTFGISLWITDKNDAKTWSCDELPLPEIQQSFIEGKEPSVLTRTEDYEMIHTVHSTYNSSINIKNLSGIGNKLSVVIRSAGPAGNPVKKLDWDGKSLTVNDVWNISFSPQPESVNLVDEKTEGWKNLKNQLKQNVSEDGWGFARIGLGNEEYTVRIIKKDSAYQSPIPYNTLFSDLKIQLPDERFAQSLNAQVANLMMSLVRDETRPGEPNNYPLPWLRDGAYTLVALARAGQIDAAKKLALFFARNDFFGGFGPEADAPGLAIWGIMQVAYEANDPQFNKEIWPHVKRKVELIRKMLTATEDIRMPITYPITFERGSTPDSNLVCEPAKDGLIIGRMDWHRPILFVNAVSYSGLKHAAILAEMTGEIETAANWKKEADALQMAWCNGFDNNFNNERTYICSFWPDWIAQPVKEKYLEKAIANRDTLHTASGDLKDRPLWTYFNVADAHQWVFLQKPEYTWKTLEYFWNNQCSPGLYTWWEGELGSEENGKLARWEDIYGWLKSNYGTNPHYWTASEMLALQLDMLAYIDESGKEPVVVIGEGVKKEWLSSPMKVEGIRLRGNILNWQWDGKTLKVNWHGNKLKVKAGSPFGENTKVLVVNNQK